MKTGYRFSRLINTVLVLALTVGSLVTSGLTTVDAKEKNVSQSTVENVVSNEREILFNEGWKFKLQDGQSLSDASKPEYDDSNWRGVTLPHDWSIELDFDHNSGAGNEGGNLPGGTGYYRKTFTLNESMQDKDIRIRFGGVYMDSTVFVNGTMIGNYPNGYTPFSYDIAEHLKFDGSENVITVQVYNQVKSSRWYSGSGIYRDVYLQVKDKVSIPEYGVTVRHPDIVEQQNGDVDTHIITEVKNQTNEKVNVKLRHTISELYATEGITEISDEFVVEANSIVEETNVIKVNKPALWSVDNPNMYKVKTEVIVNGEVTDVDTNRFGYRYTDWTPTDGFSLNGEYLKFHGVSMHHDQGALGAVANYDAMKRQMLILKDMGVNAVRGTHNPMDDRLLEIMEEVGLLYIEEAFDTWYGSKKQYDYGRFFDQPATHPEAEAGMVWSEYDIKQMVKRGKNSPAIIMWSLGNEIGEAYGDERSVRTIKNLQKWVNEIDPTGDNKEKGNFRYTTTGQIAYIWGPSEGYELMSSLVDAVGINYAEEEVDGLMERHPDWLVYGAETSSAVRSRGVYAFPDELRNHDNGSYRNFQQSDYGNDKVAWGKYGVDSWTFDRDRKGYAGQFIWTGFDYIGEPTPWINQDQTKAKSSYFGIVDTAGFPKNDFYMYQSQWTSLEENPMVHLLPHWNWTEELLDYNMRTVDGKIPMRVYSNAPVVKLIQKDLDGNVVYSETKEFKQLVTDYGMPYQEGEAQNKLYLEWRLDYAPGSVEVIAYDTEGNEVATDEVVTADGESKINLETKNRVIQSNGTSLSYIEVSVNDANGVYNPISDTQIDFEISGNGQIVGVDNGNAATFERYKAQHDGSWTRKLFNGKAIVIVQSTTNGGDFTLEATSQGLETDKIKVFTRAAGISGNELLGFDDLLVTTVINTQPELPKTVEGIYSNNTTKELDVTWEDIDSELLKTQGEFDIEGTVEGTDIKVRLTVIVQGVQFVKDVYVSTPVNVIPELPTTSTIIFNTYFEDTVEINWEREITEEDVSKAGTVEVKGTATYANEEYPVTAFISVKDYEPVEENIALFDRTTGYPKVTGTFEADDRLTNIVDGDLGEGSRWTNWYKPHFGKNETDSVTLEFEQAYEIDNAILHFFVTKDTLIPKEVIISTSVDGVDFTPVVNQSQTKDFDAEGQIAEITFDKVEAKFVRISMTGQVRDPEFAPVGLREVEIMAFVDKFNPNTKATLESISVDDVEIEDFDAAQTTYIVEVPFATPDLELTAKAALGSHVTIVQPRENNDYHGQVIVTSEDGNESITYDVYYDIAKPLMENVELKIDKLEVTEDDKVAYAVKAFLETGDPIDNKLLDVEFVFDGPGLIKDVNNELHFYDEGIYEVYANVSYFTQTIKTEVFTIKVAKNHTVKEIVGFHDSNVLTDRNIVPELPEKVLAKFDSGLDREVDVVWDEYDHKELDKYGVFTILGSVEGTDIKAKLNIRVSGIIGVENSVGQLQSIRIRNYH